MRILLRKRSLFIVPALGMVAVCFWPLAAQEKAGGPEIVATFKGHTDVVYAVAMSQDGKYVATGSFDKTIRMWDSKSGKCLRVLKGHSAPVMSIRISLDAKKLLRVCLRGNVFRRNKLRWLAYFNNRMKPCKTLENINC